MWRHPSEPEPRRDHESQHDTTITDRSYAMREDAYVPKCAGMSLEPPRGLVQHGRGRRRRGRRDHDERRATSALDLIDRKPLPNTEGGTPTGWSVGLTLPGSVTAAAYVICARP